MPIYEYVCRLCEEDFEHLKLSAQDTPACPACGSRELSRKLSVARVGTGGGPQEAAPASTGGGCCGGGCGCHSN